MDAKFKHIGTKTMVPISPPSKCEIFSIFFGYTNESTLHWKKSCPSFLHRVPETLIQQKLHSRILLSQNAIDVSVTSSCVQKMTRITET